MTDALTNEALKGICNSTFDLANYAMDLGRYYIKSGHETSMREILRDVKRNPNPSYVQDLKDFDEQEMRDRRENER